MTKKLTPWFPGTVKPASDAEHIGVYRRKLTNGDRVFARWNGRFWCCWTWSLLTAATKIGKSNVQVCAQWRGLAEKP